MIHTHLQGEPLTEEDLTDLALLRLDMMVALSVSEDGSPGFIHSAHLLPENREKRVCRVLDVVRQLDIGITVCRKNLPQQDLLS